MKTLMYRLGVLFAALMGVLSIAAYTPYIGTANQISVTKVLGGLQFALIGPYAPATYTAHGALVGEGTGSIVAVGPGTNGQLMIGSTGADPVWATLGLNGITATTGAGSLTLTANSNYLPNDNVASISCTGGYSVLSTDVVIGANASSSADCLIDLPASTGSDRVIYVWKVDSNAHNIGTTPSGADTIDGVNAVDNIATQYAFVGYWDYASGKWKKL
jgi:hypothetical protein